MRASDSTSAGLGAGPQAHLDRGRQRVGGSSPAASRQRGKILLEAPKRLFLRHGLDAATDDRALAQRLLDPRSLVCGGRVGEVDGELCRILPAREHALHVGGENQEAAQDDKRDRNRGGRDDRRSSARATGSPSASSKKYLSARIGSRGGRRGALVGVDQPAVIDRDGAAADAVNQLAIVRRDRGRSCRAR